MGVANIQLGKNSVTENFITTLKEHFKNYENVRISVLKSCCRDKAELRKISGEILEKLGNNFTARVIGYTIVVKKWRKARR
jgi:RNA-binding protein YhbY